MKGHGRLISNEWSYEQYLSLARGCDLNWGILFPDLKKPVYTSNYDFFKQHYQLIVKTNDMDIKDSRNVAIYIGKCLLLIMEHS